MVTTSKKRSHAKGHKTAKKHKSHAPARTHPTTKKEHVHLSVTHNGVSPTLATNDTIESGKLAALNRNLKSIGLTLKKHLVNKSAAGGATVVYALHHFGAKNGLVQRSHTGTTAIVKKVGTVLDQRQVVLEGLKKSYNYTKETLAGLYKRIRHGKQTGQDVKPLEKEAQKLEEEAKKIVEKMEEIRPSV